MTDKVLLERRGPVALMTINRPDQRNCVDGETAVGIAESIEAFAADDDARVLVVTGAGDLSFCAGADLKHGDTLLRHEWVDRAAPMGFARLDPGKPTIAAVNGYCFAGGFELAAWCDFRIAADKHYLTDVASGAAIGAGIGLTVPLLMKRDVAVTADTHSVALVGQW